MNVERFVLTAGWAAGYLAGKADAALDAGLRKVATDIERALYESLAETDDEKQEGE